MSRSLAPLLPALLFGATCAQRVPPAPPAAATTPACTESGSPPVYAGPWASAEELCAQAPRGAPAPDFTPPSALADTSTQAAYGQRLQSFLVNRDYQGLGWLGDAHWRLTGPVGGCSSSPESYGTHPAVHIVYSPEIIGWLCDGRQGEIPDGAMIIKEMHALDTLIVDPSTQKLSVPQDYTPTEWTVMVRGKDGSWDGWYWGDFSPGYGNPPVLTRSAVSVKDFPVAPTAPDPSWLPTGNTAGTVVFPYSSLGNYCINCHASAVSASTYATLNTVIGKEILYDYLGPSTAPVVHHGLHDALQAAAAKKAASDNPFPPALSQPDPDFVATFPQLAPPSFSTLWDSRFPAQTWDHVLSGPKGAGPFLSSDQCQSCHDATHSNASTPNMLAKNGDATTNISPYAEWRASPMGLAGRDPIFFAQLESERNLALGQGSLAKSEDCIQNLCLHCHGVQGQRTYALDTVGQDPSAGRCDALMPPEERPKTPSTSKLFSRDRVRAWPDEDPTHAAYGGLARDGISCTTCHHIDEADLGEEQTFTGNFRVGPDKEINGPYSNPKVKPMEHALGLTPKQAPWMAKSELCSSCHAINLPVFKNDGSLVGFSYEQTTYLEWLNSSFNPDTSKEGARSCQDCHMPSTYHGKPLAAKIANIEDASFSDVENRLPDEDIALETRDPFHRHTLVGLNVFLNAFFQQFPMELGLTQMDYLYGLPTPGLITTRESTLELARTQTASASITSLGWSEGALDATVAVTNLAGHSLPSGVGFRRVFLEFLVLDSEGKALWASGRSDGQGVLLDGLSDTELPTEFFSPGPRGQPRIQPHHQVIRSGDQVQIYEELVADSAGQVTTSFLHRVTPLKDNRLRPRGWDKSGPQAEHTRPEGKETLADPDYSAAVLTGSDQIRYLIPLDAATRARVASVQVTLYSQSIPPYYLAQRFQIAKDGPHREDTTRLYGLASALNTDARDASGEAYLAGWKLRLVRASARVPPT